MSIIKYITAEVTKCDLGEANVMEGNLNCSNVTGVNIAKAAVNALTEFKNPYKPNDKAVVNYSVGTGADANAGIIGITGDGPKSNGFPTTVYVNSCVKIPCNPSDNRIHSTLTFWYNVFMKKLLGIVVLGFYRRLDDRLEDRGLKYD